MVKVRKEYEAVLKAYSKNYRMFSDIYKYYSSLSQYPFIDCAMALKICHALGLTEDKNLTPKVIIKQYQQTNIELTDQKNNPDAMLTRFELFEFFVRIASIKYGFRDKAECFTDFIEYYLQPLHDATIRRHFADFRQKYLSGTGVDNFTYVNKKALKTLFEEVCHSGASSFGLDRLDTFNKFLGTNLSHETLVHLFGLSKTIVPDVLTRVHEFH